VFAELQRRRVFRALIAYGMDGALCLSDGIAEEILNALAQAEGLRVAGRTSSFYAKADGPEGNVAYRVAMVHAWRGEDDSAFAWLERAYARHDLELRWLKNDVFLGKIRSDPRFGAFLRKMNLPVE
jgi:hypothetical protein